MNVYLGGSMKKVAILFGGMSSEHSVSCISAYNVISNIDVIKYQVTLIGIDKNGIFNEYTGETIKIKEGSWENDIPNVTKIKDVISYIKRFDCVFPVLHGKYGEDGKIQGILEYAKVNYVGCDLLGGAIAMHKIFAKEIAKQNNIPIVPYMTLTKWQWNDKSNDMIIQTEMEKEGLHFPVFVKPNQEGSSFGASKAETKEQLLEALENAFVFDDVILIEQYISQRKEVECAVIEKGKEIYVSTPGEIISANEFYDFDAKYENSKSQIKIPATLETQYLQKIREYALQIFKYLHLKGLSRIDFFVSQGKIYFNEANTMPGFTNTSMYPKMLEYDGITYPEIIEYLLQNAIKE